MAAAWTNSLESHLKQHAGERVFYDSDNGDYRVSGAMAKENGIVIRSEDIARLIGRIETAERRALEMSTHGAKAFARSVRTVAFLEGECSRLRILVDHLRSVNIKLTGDIQTAHEQVSV